MRSRVPVALLWYTRDQAIPEAATVSLEDHEKPVYLNSVPVRQPAISISIAGLKYQCQSWPGMGVSTDSSLAQTFFVCFLDVSALDHFSDQRPGTIQDTCS